MESAAAYSELDDEQPARPAELRMRPLPSSKPTSAHNSSAAAAAAAPLASSSAPSAVSPVSHAAPSSPASAWLYQLWCLFRKSFWQLSRLPLMAAAAFLLPIACVVVLQLISRAVYSSSRPSAVSHQSFSTVVERCVTKDIYGRQSSASVPCTSSISYAPSSPATDSIIERLLAGTALSPRDVSSFSSAYELQLHWTRNVGSQDVAILFSNDSGTIWNVSVLNDYQYRYTLWYNRSQDNAEWRVLAIQFALEQAIANSIIATVVDRYPLHSHSLNSSDADSTSAPPSVTAMPPPSPLTPTSLSYSFLRQLTPPASSISQFNDRVSQYAGASLLSLCAAIFGLLVVQLVTAEKQAKLLAMLRMNGMFDSAYWLSTLLLWSAIALLASLLATAVGSACGLQVYANVSFMAHWLSLWLYMVAMIAAGLFLSSLFTKAAWINLLSFLFVALIIGYSVDLTIASGQYQYPPALLRVSHSIPIVAFLHGLLPVYHYSKLWYVFSQSSQWQTVSNQTYLDGVVRDGRPINGGLWPLRGILELQQFSLADMSRPAMQADGDRCYFRDYSCCDYMAEYYKHNHNPLRTEPCTIAAPPSANLGYLVLLTALYTALAWYASQVGDERAGGKKAWFLCTPSYWWSSYAHRRQVDQVVDGDTQAAERERSRVQQSIRTVKLTKAFKGVTAVKELTLQMDQNECFCLLGHNGAGQRSAVQRQPETLTPCTALFCSSASLGMPLSVAMRLCACSVSQARQRPSMCSPAYMRQRTERRTCVGCPFVKIAAPSIRYWECAARTTCCGTASASSSTSTFSLPYAASNQPP